MSARSGTVTVSSSGGDLDVVGDVTAGGVANITLTTTNAGDITVAGEVTAADDTVTVSSFAAIDGPGRISAGTVALTAGTSIGTVQAVELAATSFSATAANGNIDIDSVSGALVSATTLAATSGGIDVDHTGGGPITFGPARVEDDEETRDERIARVRAAAEERMAKLEAKRRAAERAADAELADAMDPEDERGTGVF